MKHVLTVLAAIMFLVPAAQAAAPAKTHDIVVKINGMVCDVCAQSVKKTFMKNEAVKDVSINLDTGEVIVDLKPKATLADEDIKKMIDHAGYDVVTIKR